MHTGTLESISFAASVGEREGSCSSESREAGGISVGERPRSPTWHHFGDEDRGGESEELTCRSEARSEESGESRVRSGCKSGKVSTCNRTETTEFKHATALAGA